MIAPDTWSPADPLATALEFLRMSETTYYHSELSAPWGLVMPEDCPKFHFVTSGQCWLEIDDGGGRAVEAGDLVVIPHGLGHRLASSPSAPPTDFAALHCARISPRYAMFRKNGDGPVATIICGDLNFKHPGARHLVALLPKVIHIRAEANHAIGWLHGTMGFMAAEAGKLRPGGEAIITRLADIVVIQAILHWIEENPAQQKGWLAALQDPQISRALGAIHRDPGKSWTVAGLAGSVAMSRSAFSARFSALVGEPMMQYLTRWRMHVAEVQLRAGNKTQEEIAAELGYQSGAAFSRAFRRTYGYWPGAVRRAKTPRDSSTASKKPKERSLEKTPGRRSKTAALSTEKTGRNR